MTGVSSARCGGCGSRYDRPAFARLEAVVSLDAPRLIAHVTRWPEGLVVDVRRCAQCRTPIAHLRRVGSELGPGAR